MNVFTEISTRELENTLKGKAVRYIVNDAGEGLCLFFEGWTDNTGSNHGDAIHISPVIDAAGKNLANPVAQILSAAMLLEHFGLNEEGALIRKAVDASLDANVRTPEIQVEGGAHYGTTEVGAWIVNWIKNA